MVKTAVKKSLKKQDVNKKNSASISSADRLKELLSETEKELSGLEPQIEKLEKQLDKLKELKLTKQKLITLKLSLKSILANFNLPDSELSSTGFLGASAANKLSDLEVKYGLKTSQKPNSTGAFLPELAFQEAGQILRRKDSLNYELFRAVVFKGGTASTEEIKAYLVEHKIKQPSSGEGFEAVELTDISSRINYLVRKGLVDPEGRGRFKATVGWCD